MTCGDLNAVLQRVNKNKRKIEKIQTFDLIYFLGKHILGNDSF